MAEKETKNEPKTMIEATPEEIESLREETGQKEIKEKESKKTHPELESWIPKTELGKLVKSGKQKDINEILDKGKRILEPQITEALLELDSELISVGQAKGKFGGGKRRAWRQTQKKTQEGNVLTFSAMAIVGDKKGHIGIGFGKAKETLPARDKALRNAKLNIMRISLGFESPELEKDKSNPHTVPFKISGKCGSVGLTLLPAPRGTGLVIGDECKKILKLAGIKDVYSRAQGHTKTTFNLAKACISALEKLSEVRK